MASTGSLYEVQYEAANESLGDLQDSLLSAIIAAVNEKWPAFAETTQIHLSNGITTVLDPLNIAGLVHAGGGPCPLACGTVELLTIEGLSTAQITTADADKTVSMQWCDETAFVLTLPITFADLNVTANVDYTLLKLGKSLPTAAVTWRNMRGTLTVTIPLIDGPEIGIFGNVPTFVTQLRQATVEVVLDISSVSTASDVPFFAKPLLNDALLVGAKAPLQRLADSHLSSILSNEIQSYISDHDIKEITFRQAWVNPVLPDTPPIPLNQACKLTNGVPASFTLPCDPCDKCCKCATESNCGSTECVAECGTCMPLSCKKQVPAQLVWGATAIGTVTVWILLLVLFGILALTVWGVRAIVHKRAHARGSGSGSGALSTK